MAGPSSAGPSETSVLAVPSAKGPFFKPNLAPIDCRRTLYDPGGLCFYTAGPRADPSSFPHPSWAHMAGKTGRGPQSPGKILLNGRGPGSATHRPGQDAGHVGRPQTPSGHRSARRRVLGPDRISTQQAPPFSERAPARRSLAGWSPGGPAVAARALTSTAQRPRPWSLGRPPAPPPARGARPGLGTHPRSGQSRGPS